MALSAAIAWFQRTGRERALPGAVSARVGEWIECWDALLVMTVAARGLMGCERRSAG